MNAEEWQGKVEALEDEIAEARRVLVLFAAGKPEAQDAYDDFLCEWDVWQGIDGPIDLSDDGDGVDASKAAEQRQCMADMARGVRSEKVTVDQLFDNILKSVRPGGTK